MPLLFLKRQRMRRSISVMAGVLHGNFAPRTFIAV